MGDLVNERKVVKLDQGEIALVWATDPDEILVSLPGPGWAVETVHQAQGGRDYTKVVLVRRLPDPASQPKGE